MNKTRYRRAAKKAAATRKANSEHRKRSAAAKVAWGTRRTYYGPTGTVFGYYNRVAGDYYADAQ